MPKSKRIDSLQIVRAIAFFGIYLYHAIRRIPGKGMVYRFFSQGLGPWGVSVFFVLSGFLMTYSYWNREPDRSLKGMALFAVHKIKKLYPLHLIMLFWGVVFSYLKHGSVKGSFFKLLVSIPLIQTWFPKNYQAINNVAWYLSVCLFLYFMFPCLLPVVKKNELQDKNTGYGLHLPDAACNRPQPVNHSEYRYQMGRILPSSLSDRRFYHWRNSGIYI